MNITDNQAKNTCEVLKMKKLILITGAVIYLMLAVSVFVSARIEGNSGNMQFYADSGEGLNTENEDYLYMVTVSDGVIVVKNREDEVVNKTDVFVSVLPQQDRENLEKGIKVYDEKQLRALLEDFCS